IWAQRTGARTSPEVWTLRRRIFDPVAGTWGTEDKVTEAGASEQVTDREPGAVLLADGTLRVFFRSNRAGGNDLWSVLITPATSAVSDPLRITSGPSFDGAPTPQASPQAGRLWLFYRSDRSVSPSLLATRALTFSTERTLLPGPGHFVPSMEERSFARSDT